jgi:hypothetical protein
MMRMLSFIHILVFYVMASCSLVASVSEEYFYPENGSSVLLSKLGDHAPDYTVL